MTTKQLEVKETVVLEVSHSDLEDFIRQVYGVEYEYAVTQESNNGSYKRYNVYSEHLSEWEERELEEFVKDENMCSIRIIFADLLRKKVIKAGIYLVSVSW